MSLPAGRSIAAAIVTLAFAAAVSFGAWSQVDSTLTVTVTSVIDGDTIKVQLETGPATVRLANIDAPEAIQPGGGAATRALHAKVLGEWVTLQSIRREDEQHLVAVVMLGEENVNAWMVKRGHAWADRGSFRDPNYCAWEHAARSLRRGLWSGDLWVAPWDWRMTQRDALFFVTDYSHASTAGCMREMSKSANIDE